MKKKVLLLSTLAMGLAFTACTKDEVATVNGGKDTENKIIEEINSEDNVEYTPAVTKAWGNYMRIVGGLLVNDATTLYKDWTISYKGGKPYAQIFKEHNSDTEHLNSAYDCVSLLVTYMDHIADEVSTSKIGEPLKKYTTNWMSKENMKEGLYAVESWYSWHSRLDYTNNILSIRNGYYGVYDKDFAHLSTAAKNSLYTYIQAKNPALNKKVSSAIQESIDAIQNIPQPFRNHINSNEAKKAQEACGNLNELLAKDVQTFLEEHKNDDKGLDPIVTHIVDNVIVPIYTDLVKLNTKLNKEIIAFAENPTNEGFEKCCQAWMNARQPWETSEAYLFGPVKDKGLDPNMDTWPLDIDGIKNILHSQKFGDLEWKGKFVEEDEENPNALSPEDKKQAENIGAAQSLRGYHTIEFLIFKNGKARTIKK